MTVYRAQRRGFGAYLSGPIEGCTEEQANGWRREIDAALKDIMPVRIPPVANDANDYAEMLLLVKQDLTDIDDSLYVIANPWKNSTGTPMEVMYAHMQGKVVIVIARPDGFVAPWHRYHADYVAKDVADVIRYIKEAPFRVS